VSNARSPISPPTPERAPRDTGPLDRWPGFTYHKVTGSRNLMAQDVIISAFLLAKQSILINVPNTEARDRAMNHLMSAFDTALAALGMDSATPRTERP